ncbi:MAG: 3-hydroxyacyl-CoA dehydrogenase NAD-binding domain-containing protein [Thiotrichales bacterium]|nr:3-hydroxyacyl-CoA dehydrogenase NAD-binding domain-containing protein [Thiotrichales bacterium]
MSADRDTGRHRSPGQGSDRSPSRVSGQGPGSESGSAASRPGIERVAVIGSGVMGGGIAAQLANAGARVLLLDVAAKDGSDRSAVARAAVERLSKSRPPAFMHRSAARRIDVGNIDDDLARTDEADWIVEAVVERLDVKRDLYARLDAVRKPGAIVSSNTSTIPLARLVEGASDALRRDFAITHFFNPPRYMRLLEIVRGPEIRPEQFERLRTFADLRLGKGVVECKDTPGFIANRIGVYWMQCAMIEAMRAGLSVEQADTVLGPAVGIPKTGVFGLADLVGLDLMPHVVASMDSLLAPDDALRSYVEMPDLVRRMIADGYTGRKGRGGFYRLRREGSERVRESIDLATGEYRRSERVRLAGVEAAKSGGPRALLEHDSDEGRYAWRVLSSVIAYSAALVPEISDDIADVDAAMRLGYNWQAGPFEMADRLGADWLAERLRGEGRAVPPMLEAAHGAGFYRAAPGSPGSPESPESVERMDAAGRYAPIRPSGGAIRLGDAKRGRTRVIGNDSASLWDVGRDVACLEFHTRMNTFDPAVMQLIAEALDRVPGCFAGMVIHNDAEHFSAGVDLRGVVAAMQAGAPDRLASAIEFGQNTFGAMKYAPFPVVGAPAGMALGGGCEILLHCDAIVAHAETCAGLVEAGVGLIPAWGGCKELLARFSHAGTAGAAGAAGSTSGGPMPGGPGPTPGGPMPPVNRAFELVGLAKVSQSAAEAREFGILRRDDVIVMNRDRVLGEAVDMVHTLAADYIPPEPPVFHLPGRSGKAALALAIGDLERAGKATPHDVVVANALARVLTGGDADLTDEVTEDDLLALEREAALSLLGTEGTQARIAHMLETGKPLRN